MARGALWSPYYKITVGQNGPDTVVEVNNIFHQSMAPVAQKEYFYQWPYTVFGDTFKNVLILGAGSGTDVAAALMHGAEHVDAVEIDPTILRLGRQLHPDHPFDDPRVTVINDDARHFLRTTNEEIRPRGVRADRFADACSRASRACGSRATCSPRSRSARSAIGSTPDGLLVVYNYFREKWLVDRLANIAAAAFGAEPRVHVHEARAYLGIMLAGPAAGDADEPTRSSRIGSPPTTSRTRRRRRGCTRATRRSKPATDDWPFLYLRDRHIPRHYLVALALILVVSVASVLWVLRGQGGGWSWQFFFLGAGFMLLETKAIIQFALLWGSTWVVASLAIAAVLTMALLATFIVSRVEIRRPWLVGGGAGRPAGCSTRSIPVGRVALREPRRRVGLLRGADVQPDPVRRPAVRLGDQALDLAGARLRHQPARRDGRRRGRIPVAR